MTGIDNVFSGLKHFPKHLWNYLTDPDSVVGKLFAKPLSAAVTYEKAHGQEELEKALKAGIAAFKETYVPGKGAVIKAVEKGVEAFFESGAESIKQAFTTQQAVALISGAVDK